MIPDVERLIGAYVRERGDMVALVGDRLGPDIPEDTSVPWVRLTVLDIRSFRRSRTEHAWYALATLECYGGGDQYEAQGEAWSISRTARAALAELDGANVTLEDMVVSCVEFSRHGRIPDTRFEPSRERVILDADIYFHRA